MNGPQNAGHIKEIHNSFVTRQTNTANESCRYLGQRGEKRKPTAESLMATMSRTCKTFTRFCLKLLYSTLFFRQCQRCLTTKPFGVVI